MDIAYFRNELYMEKFESCGWKVSHGCSFYTVCTFAWINNWNKGLISVVFLKFVLPVISEKTELRKTASKSSLRGKGKDGCEEFSLQCNTVCVN